MTANEGTFIGLAKQTAKGTPNVTDAEFQYLLVRESSIGPNNVTIPLDKEMGGGALPRGMVRVGVTSGGMLDLIPRPDTIGHFLLGALGAVAAPVPGAAAALGSHTHVFTLAADNFAAPYYTVRNAPGGAWGEQYQDQRVSALALNFRGARYVDSQVGFVGGLPTPLSTAAWSPAAKVDGGPQFLTVTGSVELPTGTPVKVLSGAFISGMAIPLDEQWIIGSYVPDAFDITGRTFALNLIVKIADSGALYKKLMFDPAGTAAWTADIFREGRIKILLNSDTGASTDLSVKYSLQIEANGAQGAASNVFFSATPIGLRAGRNLVMSITGLFTASPDGVTEPIKVTLVNKRATTY